MKKLNYDRLFFSAAGIVVGLLLTYATAVTMTCSTSDDRGTTPNCMWATIHLI